MITDLGHGEKAFDLCVLVERLGCVQRAIPLIWICGYPSRLNMSHEARVAGPMDPKMFDDRVPGTLQFVVMQLVARPAIV